MIWYVLNIIHHNFFFTYGKEYLEENIRVSTVFMPTSFPFCVQLVSITLLDFVIHEHSPALFSFFTFTPNLVYARAVGQYNRVHTLPIGWRSDRIALHAGGRSMRSPYIIRVQHSRSRWEIYKNLVLVRREVENTFPSPPRERGSGWKSAREIRWDDCNIYPLEF